MPTPLFAHAPTFWRLHELHKAIQLEKNQFECQKMPGSLDVPNQQELSVIKDLNAATLTSKAFSSAKESKVCHAQSKTHNQTLSWKESTMQLKPRCEQPIPPMQLKQTIQSIKLSRLRNVRLECASTRPMEHHQAV